MRWSSIDELIKDLELEIDSSDEASVKSEIRKQLSIIHPDKNNGRFSSDSAKERFNKLTEALKFLSKRKKESQALISIDPPSAIIKAITTALAPTKEERLNRERDECRNIRKSAIRSRYFFPRLRSGFFAGLCGLLVTFGEQLKTHPLFSQFLTLKCEYSRAYRLARNESLDSIADRLNTSDPVRESFNIALKACTEERLKILLPILTILFIYFGVLFLLTWVNERRDEAKGEWLLSEEGLRSILRQVLRKKSGPLQGTGNVFFTNRDFESEIQGLYKSKKKYKLPFRHYEEISSSFAEKTAKIHLEELASRSIIKRIEGSKFDVTYEIEREIADELEQESTEAKA